MSNDQLFDQTFAVLHEHRRDAAGRKVLTGNSLAALIPNAKFQPLLSQIVETRRALMDGQKARASLVTEGQVQRFAAICPDCNLCMTCAGNHRTYSKDFAKCWPPGGEKCFAFVPKAGKMLRESPCELCANCDLQLRKARGARARYLGNMSKLRTELQQHYAARQLLFAEFIVETHVFRE